MIKRLYTREQLQEMNTSELNRALKKELQENFKGVKFSVKKTFGDPYVEYDADANIDVTEVKAVAGFFNVSYHDVRVQGYLTSYHDTPEHQEEQRIENEKYQAEQQKRIDERNKIYNSNVTIEKINNENIKIIDVSNKDVFVKALEPSLNKNNWKIDNDEEIDKSAYLNKYKITDIVAMNEAEYNYFSFNLLTDYSFLTGKGGWEADENGKGLYNYGVAIVCEGKETLIIDPSGSNYARYTNRLIEDINNTLQNEIEISVKANTKEFNNKIDSIEDKQLYHVTANKETAVNDNRFILNDYTGITAVTGKALKELIFECRGISLKPIEKMKLNQSIEIFAEGIMKMETGACIELFTNTRDSIKDIKFSQRLEKELSRVA